MTGGPPGERRGGARSPAAARAYAAALSALPGMGPATLVRILAERDPIDAWEAVRAGAITRPDPRRRPAPIGEAPTGDAEGVEARALFGDPEEAAGGGAAAGSGSARAQLIRRRPAWADVARRVDPQQWWAPFRARRVGVTWPGQPDYPDAFVADPQPPGVLFWRGDLGVLDARRVAIVGTRNATPDGRATAFEMGRDLGAAGVCVVSGLALGIDGAAHAGVLTAHRDAGGAGPAGVAASGVDVPYPRRHAGLWEDVVRTGVLMSETVPGRPAQAWRFPARNRLIAALAELVVVVESHQGGGSLITAEAAIERGVEVRVVPGPVHSPASAGSNQLLYDGPGPVRHARDVLDALGMFRSAPTGGAPAEGAPTGPAPVDRRAGRPPGLPPGGAAVLEAMGWRPVHTGQVMARAGLDAAAVTPVLDLLVAAGCVVEEGGWWTRVR